MAIRGQFGTGRKVTEDGMSDGHRPSSTEEGKGYDTPYPNPKAVSLSGIRLYARGFFFIQGKNPVIRCIFKAIRQGVGHSYAVWQSEIRKAGIAKPPSPIKSGGWLGLRSSSLHRQGGDRRNVVVDWGKMAGFACRRLTVLRTGVPLPITDDVSPRSDKDLGKGRSVMRLFYNIFKIKSSK